MVKILNLNKGELGYIVIAEGSQLNVEETQIRQKGKRFILVKST